MFGALMGISMKSEELSGVGNGFTGKATLKLDLK